MNRPKKFRWIKLCPETKLTREQYKVAIKLLKIYNRDIAK